MALFLKLATANILSTWGAIALAAEVLDVTDIHPWELPWKELSFCFIVSSVFGLATQLRLIHREGISWGSLFASGMGGGMVGALAGSWALNSNFLPLVLLVILGVSGIFGGRFIDTAHENFPTVLQMAMGWLGRMFGVTVPPTSPGPRRPGRSSRGKYSERDRSRDNDPRAL